MNTIKYQAFLTVAQQGSITKTADTLNYTQPAITHMIKSLEKEFELPLFHRYSDKVVLTDEAQRLLPYIQRIITNEKSMIDEINQIKDFEVGDIHMGAYMSAIVSYLPEMMELFQNKYPGIVFHLIEGNEIELYRLLKNGTVDFAFAVRDEFTDFEFLPLIKDRWYVVAPKGHPICENDIVTVEEFVKYPVISYEEGGDFNFLRVIGEKANDLNIRIRARTEISIISLVAANLGVALIPELFLHEEYKNIEIKALESRVRYRDVGIVCQDFEALSIISKNFINMVTEHMEEWERKLSRLISGNRI